MDRARRLRELWSWLPAFRAAAETEHLPTAGEAMRVSPSAISRAVKLLEDELGVSLFDREGRAMRLNRDGRLLLDSLRDAMRILDESIDSIDPRGPGATLRGAVSMSVPAEHAATLASPAIALLTESHPELSVELVTPASADPTAALLSGRIDVGVTEEPPDDPQLRVELLAEIERAVYRREDIAATGGWVVSPGDGWPVGVDRHVVVRAPDVAAAAEIASRTSLLVALPVPVAARGARLIAVTGAPAIEPARIYVAFRRPVTGHRRTEAVIAALREAATSASRDANRG